MATAVQGQWPMASLDVSEAFLKGFTFDKIQERRGGPKRRVSLTLPRCKAGEPSGSSILRTIRGYEDFDESSEVLEMLKGGFGLIDAPNLFTSRVNEVFVAHGVHPTCAEPKIYLRRSSGVKAARGESSGSSPGDLDLMVSAHMDDFKSTGPQPELDWLHGILSKHLAAMRRFPRGIVHSHGHHTHTHQGQGQK